MAGKKGRKPQEWALNTAMGITREVLEGRPLPYQIEGLELEGNGLSIRFLQEVGFAKTWLEKQEESVWANALEDHIRANAAKKKGEQTPQPLLQRPHRAIWSVKRELNEGGKYIFFIGFPTAGGASRGQGKMEAAMSGFLQTQAKREGRMTIEELAQRYPAGGKAPEASPSPAEHKEPEEDASEALLKKLGYT